MKFPLSVLDLSPDAVGRDSVVVDIGGKSEGVIALNEFADATGQVAVKAGDSVDVFIEARENDVVEFDSGHLIVNGKQVNEPYVHGLSCHLLIPLPPWLPEKARADNWQTSAFDRAAAPLTSTPSVVTADDGREHF